MRTIKKKCEQILVNCPVSKVPIKEQLVLADKYVLPELMEKCMAGFTTIAQLKAATPKDVDELSQITIKRMFQRVVDLNN